MLRYRFLRWPYCGTFPLLIREKLCEDLSALSLVKAYRRGSATLQLHDVIRDHLRHEMHGQLAETNRIFLTSVKTNLRIADNEWWTLPKNAAYLWRNLAFHMQEAELMVELAKLVCDLRWAEERITNWGLAAYEADLMRIDDPLARLLHRTLVRKGHLLGPIVPAHAHADILVSRVEEHPELSSLVANYRSMRSRSVAHIVSSWPIPPVDPALIRVLDDHLDIVTDCSISQDGKFLATSSSDRTVRIWDTETWNERALLRGHSGGVEACAFSGDGLWLASAGRDGTLQIWKSANWTRQATLTGHVGVVTSCVFTRDGLQLVSTGEDQKIRIWSVENWSLIREVTGHAAEITDSSVSPSGHLLATSSTDSTIRLWETENWSTIRILSGHEAQWPVSRSRTTGNG